MLWLVQCPEEFLLMALIPPTYWRLLRLYFQPITSLKPQMNVNFAVYLKLLQKSLLIISPKPKKKKKYETKLLYSSSPLVHTNCIFSASQTKRLSLKLHMLSESTFKIHAASNHFSPWPLPPSLVSSFALELLQYPNDTATTAIFLKNELDHAVLCLTPCNDSSFQSQTRSLLHGLQIPASPGSLFFKALITSLSSTWHQWYHTPLFPRTLQAAVWTVFFPCLEHSSLISGMACSLPQELTQNTT